MSERNGTAGLAFVTGAAGFIGSTLVDRLLARGETVVGYDNFSSGQRRFLEGALTNPRFKLIEGDLLDLSGLTEAMRGASTVYHLAANADVRFGLEHPDRDLKQNTIATFNVLEAMRAIGARRIAFSSTGSVYGESKVIPTPEDAPFPIQTSLYAASKVAGETLIHAYCEGFGFQSWIFRFVSVLGERYTHGHVFDFTRSILADPSRLKVLGDGRQRKSYMYVQDCVDAIFLAIELANERVNVLNLGVDEYCEIKDSVGWITSKLGASPQLDYAGGARGWVGDNPFIYLDTRRIRDLGWSPKLNIRQGIERTASWLMENRWVFEARS